MQKTKCQKLITRCCFVILSVFKERERKKGSRKGGANMLDRDDLTKGKVDFVISNAAAAAFTSKIVWIYFDPLQSS